jgi:DNA-binding NarL/FixJ family response regulator
VSATEKREQVEALLYAGHSDLAIHRQTGVDRGTVRRYRKRLGLPGYRVTADSPACRHGHPFPENIAHYPNGWLYCLACSRIRGRNRVSIHRPRKASTRRPRKARTRQPRKRTSTYVPVQPDEIAIERAVAGDPPDRLTPRERAAAIAQLDRRDYSAAVIAEYVRCTPRTVHRVRARGASA